MSLISHWRDRKKFLGYTKGRPLWFLIILLVLVFLIIRWLGQMERTLSM